ncbi:MerR family transcriptional regulator [Pasteurella multocida]|nr:MerR family transcriptional regulator [Pasteurella multocida]
MSKFFKIKQASEQTGVHLETIRYYEKQGLIAPTHQQNGYRVFDENQLEQLRFIKTCRNIGLSLSNIKTLLQLQQKRLTNNAMKSMHLPSNIWHIWTNKSQNYNKLKLF